MTQGGMIQVALSAFGTETVFIPKGTITIFSTLGSSDFVGLYAGNNANGNFFPIYGQNYITIENFVGGQYTFLEQSARSANVFIWCQGLEEYV